VLICNRINCMVNNKQIGNNYKAKNLFFDGFFSFFDKIF